METFRKDLLEEFIGKPLKFCQDNESLSKYGVLRGMHHQLPPHAQDKLVRVVKGKILDVVVDVRKASVTFGQHVTVELSAENAKQLYIPKGFAHGFVVLSESAQVVYKVDDTYHPESYAGFAYNDPQLNIDWKLPKEDLIVSEQDMQMPAFKRHFFE